MISCGWWLWLMVAVAVAGGCGKLGRWLLHAVARGSGWCPVILALAVSLAVVLAGDWWLVAVGMAEGVAVAVATYLRLAQLSLFPIAHSSLRALSLAAPFSLSLCLSRLSLSSSLSLYTFSTSESEPIEEWVSSIPNARRTKHHTQSETYPTSAAFIFIC